MTVSGPEALRSLEEALRDVRREEDEIAKRLARSSELIGKLRETEGDLFRQLANVRLDPATQDELAGRLSQVELKAREMQKAHARELKGAEQKLTALDKALADLTAERAAALKAIETRRGELNALREKLTGQLDADSEFVKRRAEAADLAQVAAESMRKTELAEADRAEKGQPYRDDPLFMYLFERGYGTGAYKAGNLTRYLDGLVAQRIGFAKARPNFVMLSEIPMRLREHAERQADNAAAAEAEVAALEDRAIDAAGGRPAREALKAAEARVIEIDKEIVDTEDSRDEMAKAQQALMQGSDPAFAEAVGALAQALGREDLQALLSEARATQTAQDDTIISQIDNSRQRIAEEEKDTREHQDRLKTLAARRRELEDIQYEFKKSHYDDPRSTFKEDNLVGDLLTEFLRGGINASTYWGHWQRSQNWTGGGPPSPWGGGSRDRNDSFGTQGSGFQWPDSSFGGGTTRRGGNSGFGGGWGRLPTGGSGGGGGGGGFSRPRTGSAGTRTHGGFKTGGGF